jgi:putative transposase
VQIGAAVRLRDGTMAAPAVIRDETSGFIVGAAVLTNRREEALRLRLEELLRRHGLPWRVSVPRDDDVEGAAPSRHHSPLTVWLMRIGIVVEFHSSSATLGNAEQQSRDKLAAKLASLPAYQRKAIGSPAPATPFQRFSESAPRLDLAGAQALLDKLRHEENFQGHQEALQRRSPISLYRPSPRSLPREVPGHAYAPEADVRLVSEKGIFTFRRRLIHVGRAFAGYCVELKETPYADRFIVLFAGQLLGLAELSESDGGQATSLQLRPA